MQWLLTALLLAAFFSWCFTLFYQAKIDSLKEYIRQVETEYNDEKRQSYYRYQDELAGVMMEWAADSDRLNKVIESLRR